MRKLALAALLLAAPAFARAQTSAPAPAAVRDPVVRVDSIFARWDSAGTPGCAVGVAKDGRTLVSRAYGMADLEHDVRNTPETVFEAGSVSKQFTAAAVVLLAQQGKLSLDDDVRKHVPEMPDYGAPITLRHLINHTSGLRDWGSVAFLDGWPRGTRIHTHEHMLEIAARQKHLNYPTGTEYSYTNTGYNLLAVIVERVSGETFAAFTKRHLFEPLGMTRTEWRDDFTRIVKGRAVAYDFGGGAFRSEMPFENVHGNGGLLTTVGDLLKWNENLESGRVGGRALVDELHRQAVLTNGRKVEYAGGLFVTRHRDFDEVSHSGATAGYRGWLARYPAERLSVAVLCNAGPANPVALGHAAADVFLPAAPASSAAPAASAPTPAALPAGALEARAGVYRNTRTNTTLRLQVAEGRLRTGGGTPLTPLSPTLFQVGTGATRLEFDPADSRGRAALRVLYPDGDTVPFEPVSEWAPDAAALARFAGEYRSDETEAAYTAAVVDGKLTLRRRTGTALELTPVYTDAFTTMNGGVVVRFSRGRRGRVDGFTVYMDRLRGLRFDRVSR